MATSKICDEPRSMREPVILTGSYTSKVGYKRDLSFHTLEGLYVIIFLSSLPKTIIQLYILLRNYFMHGILASILHTSPAHTQPNIICLNSGCT